RVVPSITLKAILYGYTLTGTESLDGPYAGYGARTLGLYSRCPVRAGGRQHLGRQYRRRRSRPAIEPHPMGTHSDPLRSGRLALAAAANAARMGAGAPRLAW